MGKTTNTNGNKKTEDFDKEMQNDLNRSEGEGFAVMYTSQKNKQVEAAQKKGGKSMTPVIDLCTTNDKKNRKAKVEILTTTNIGKEKVSKTMTKKEPKKK